MTTKKRQPVEVNGATFATLAEAARFYNAGNIRKVRARMRRGWSMEEALGLTDRKPNDQHKITVEGVEFANLQAAIDAYKTNATPDIVRDRVRKLGWTLLEALTLDYKVRPHEYETEVEGVVYRSQNAAAKTLGLNKHTFRNRLAREYASNEAADEDFTLDRFSTISIPFIAFGNLYINMGDFLMQNYAEEIESGDFILARHPHLKIKNKKELILKYQSELSEYRKKHKISRMTIKEFADKLEIPLPQHERDSMEFWTIVRSKVNISDYFPDLTDRFVKKKLFPLEYNRCY